ncbi:MAG: 3-oxoacyl-ACP synthase III [Kiritimatiellaeota bacterium]|nr:3-oxoacyl-ACP synthase III [Kiritimatiellota bacterium]
MRYTKVCIEAISCVLPERVVTSVAIEQWLKPLYDRLGLHEGRLELMTGIRERRFWGRETRPSDAGAAVGRKALTQAGFAPESVDCLFHCAVSRDFVEPATATSVHRLLGLPTRALNFDISNACLGVLSGVLVAANMIQLGQAATALVVAAEDSLPLVENTVRVLRQDTGLSRREIKPYFASLTIGSAAAAVLLAHEDVTRSGHRLLGGAWRSDTRFNHLCQGNHEDDPASVGPMMQTDAEQLLENGVETARKTWTETKTALGWSDSTPTVICTHQVGRMHRTRLYSALGLDADRDFSTFEYLGNCGAASLPATAALAVEEGRVQSGDRLALLGIGSGINCTILGVQW